MVQHSRVRAGTSEARPVEDASIDVQSPVDPHRMEEERRCARCVDDEQELQRYVAERERSGADLVVVVRNLATRPAGLAAPWA